MLCSQQLKTSGLRRKSTLLLWLCQQLCRRLNRLNLRKRATIVLGIYTYFSNQYDTWPKKSHCRTCRNARRSVVSLANLATWGMEQNCKEESNQSSDTIKNKKSNQSPDPIKSLAVQSNSYSVNTAEPERLSIDCAENVSERRFSMETLATPTREACLKTGEEGGKSRWCKFSGHLSPAEM